MIKKIAILSAIALVSFLLIYCTTDESKIIGPFGDADKYLSVTNLSFDKEKVYSNGDTSFVSLKVLNVDNSPAVGLKIDFTTQFGKITESDTTDSSGVASATFISDENTGENIITVNTGIKKYTLAINVVNYQPAVIELSSESPVILADGISTTTITAVVKDSLGSPMEKMTVKFNTTLGKLSVTLGQTDKTGTIQTELTSSDTIDTAIITAESGIKKSINVKFHMDVPAYLELSAENPVLLADGVSTTTITAIVKDSTGRRMDGEPVIFTTTHGTLDEEGAISTDNNGIAKVLLTSSNEPSVALIIATSYVSDSVEVEFNINVPDRIDISASPLTILADGASISTITAIPKDKDGNIMPGLTVNFSTTLGTLSETIKLTDAEGRAITILTSEKTDGTAYVTAVSSTEGTVGVQFIAYNPAYINLSTDIDGNTVLGDGISTINVTAKVYNSANEIIPWALVEFSTTHGILLNNTTVRADQEGKATIVLRSAGGNTGVDAIVSAEVQDNNSISQTISIRFRGISITTYIDSLQFASGGYYKAYIRSVLLDIDEGILIENSTVAFSSTIGEMEPQEDITDEFGTAKSIMYAEATGVDQGGLVITPELYYASAVNDPTPSMVIPGVEALISTVDDDIMGDGEGWALVKATLRETTGKAIIDTEIDWETEVGTIIGRSTTNTNGHTIDTLRIEYSISNDINVGITAKYGNNISVTDYVTFVEPENSNRLILGFESDTTGHGIIPCNIDSSLSVREAGISALFVNSTGNGYGGELINFSIVPNNFALICPTDATKSDTTGTGIIGLANVMMVYPLQNIGEIVRVWAEAPDGTRGSIDVVLPNDQAGDGGGG